MRWEDVYQNPPTIAKNILDLEMHAVLWAPVSVALCSVFSAPTTVAKQYGSSSLVLTGSILCTLQPLL